MQINIGVKQCNISFNAHKNNTNILI